jgi:molybdopterin converting factor small subunit
MKITIKLMPPYRKKDDPGEHLLDLDYRNLDLEGLARYLSEQYKDLFGYALIDTRGLLTAEFIVNGKNAAPQTNLQEGDRVTIIPYICGG